MSVTTQAGVKLDINQVRDQLSKDRDSGKVSKGDYKKAMKGLNRIADAEKKGVNYQFTGENRFKTVSGNGFTPSMNDAGVSVGTRIPVFGKQVSKAMGYAQVIGMNNATEAEKATKSKSNEESPVSTSGYKPFTGHLNFTPNLNLGPSLEDSKGKVKGSFGQNPTVQNPAPIQPERDEISEQNKSKANQLTEEIWKAEQELAKITQEFNSKINDPWNVNFGNDFSINPKKLLTTSADGDVGINWGLKEKFNEQEIALRQKIAKLDGDLNAIEGGKYTRPHKKTDWRTADVSNVVKDQKEIGYKGGPFMPDGWMPVASIQKMPGVSSAVEKLSAPVIRLNAPKIAINEAVQNTGSKMAQIGVKSTARLNAPSAVKQLGYTPGPVRVGLPAPSVIGNVISRGQIRYGTSAILPKTKIGNWPVKQWNMGWGGVTFKKGGKVPSFQWGTNKVEDQLKKATDAAMANAGQSQWGNPVFNIVKTAKGIPSVNTSPKTTVWGSGAKEKKTMAVDRTGIGYAFNDKYKPIDKDNLINMATGAYGAASLLTAKKPSWRKPKELNLFIRPAQGDEEMVSRSNQAIDQSVAMGTSQLRSRVGSDIQSYVQGVTGMVDNAGRAKAGVLGQNAQMKRQDEVRMANEINTQKQTNFGMEEQYRQEKNLNDMQTYQNRVQGAQAAVNNSLNYGVQKRADLRNKAVERDMANKRFGMVMLNLAQTLEEQGVPPEQIERRLEQYKTLAFEKGGRIPTSERLTENAHKQVADANKELSRMFREYSRLISMASLENIRQFNQNIRAINNRRNLTITSR